MYNYLVAGLKNVQTFLFVKSDRCVGNVSERVPGSPSGNCGSSYRFLKCMEYTHVHEYIYIYRYYTPVTQSEKNLGGYDNLFFYLYNNYLTTPRKK